MKVYVISEGGIHDGSSVVDVFLNEEHALHDYSIRCERQRAHGKHIYEHATKYGMSHPEEWLEETFESSHDHWETFFSGRNIVAMRIFDREL